MRKQKLKLHRETLRQMTDGNLAGLAGGIPITEARHDMDCDGQLTNDGCDTWPNTGGCGSGQFCNPLTNVCHSGTTPYC